MRNFLLFIACAGFAISASQAQEIRFGVKGGVNFANMTMEAEGISMSPGSRTAFHIGGLVEIPLSDVFSVQPEILYNSVGSKLSIMGIESTTKLDYISIPIMAKYYFTEGFAVEAGPQVGFLMSAKSEFSSSIPMMEDGEEDVKDEFKGIDFGLGIGASYRLDMGLFFSARYVLGLSNIGEEGNNNGNDDDFDDIDFGFGGATVKNNVFQISVGYSF
ncbi:MAG: PorT family protein [Bacteroidetes bacterium]|nr:PorT family protein [Bacteroidota bacterium]